MAINNRAVEVTADIVLILAHRMAEEYKNGQIPRDEEENHLMVIGALFNAYKAIAND